MTKRHKDKKPKRQKRQNDKKTKRQKDKTQRLKREFNIVTSGQFRTLAMFYTPNRSKVREWNHDQLKNCIHYISLHECELDPFQISKLLLLTPLQLLFIRAHHSLN